MLNEPFAEQTYTRYPGRHVPGGRREDSGDDDLSKRSLRVTPSPELMWKVTAVMEELNSKLMQGVGGVGCRAVWRFRNQVCVLHVCVCLVSRRGCYFQGFSRVKSLQNSRGSGVDQGYFTPTREIRTPPDPTRRDPTREISSTP